MLPSEDPALTLARRLRDLREAGLEGRAVRQSDLARALGVSGPSISSWETPNAPKLPVPRRLRDYATFFCTGRTLIDGRFRLVDLDSLSAEERARRDRTEQELLTLRAAVARDPDGQLAPADVPSITKGGPWFFAGRPVTIVCAELPEGFRAGMPYTDPLDPDYVALYSYADPDALLELHGHIRAVNPGSHVAFKVASALDSDDLTAHLVLLGGVDWNDATRRMLDTIPLPVTQGSFVESEEPAFTVSSGDRQVSYRPTFSLEGGRTVLANDVAHFFRGVSPYNSKRTVTICNGMYARGVLGAVRALTDPRFRDRNAGYLEQRFAGGDTYSVLFRVQVVNTEVVTPDWTVADTRLHEWPEATE